MRLIDADALEELFRETIGYIAKNPKMTHSFEHMVRASAVVIEMIKDAPTIDSQAQWISVSERLPEEGTEVLGTDRDGCIRHVYKDKTGLYEFATVEEGMHIGIVAWMPLPEPWKGE